MSESGFGLFSVCYIYGGLIVLPIWILTPTMFTSPGCLVGFCTRFVGSRLWIQSLVKSNIYWNKSWIDLSNLPGSTIYVNLRIVDKAHLQDNNNESGIRLFCVCYIHDCFTALPHKYSFVTIAKLHNITVEGVEHLIYSAPQHGFNYVSTVVVYTDVWSNELHRQVGMGIVVTSGTSWCNCSTLARNARDVGLVPTLGTIIPIFITPMTVS